MADELFNEKKKSIVSDLSRIIELTPAFIAMVDKVKCEGNDYFFVVDGVKI